MSDSLETRIKETKRCLESLEEAKARKDAGRPCPNGISHKTRCLQVVAGGFSIENIKARTGLDLSLNGYQLHLCLACGEYILMNYDGSYVGIVSNKDGKWLANGMKE